MWNPDEMQDTRSITEVVGFDLGHGETALALAVVAAKTEPQVLEVQSRKSFITAVAMHPKRGIIIGEEAYTARNLDSLTVRFKSPRLDAAAVREPTKLFVRKILEVLHERSLIRGDNHTAFIVGCPSGWPPETRERYARLMREAGLQHVTIVAESRAAFIHAKESEELHVAGETLLGRSVLIVDVGSSTTDFTAVQNLKESYIDFGDTQLGAGLFDKAILDRVVARHERRQELEDIFASHPQYQAMCELKCRSVKETYFSNEERWSEDPVQETLKIPTRPPLFFDIELRRRDMQDILRQPLLKNKSWPQALRDELESARQQMRDHLPQLVFLTGGASRMNFVLEQCREVFPQATVLRGKEPELSIAKGLAWVGRIDLKTQAFRREISQLFQSGQIRQVVEGRIQVLLTLVAAALVQALPEHVVLPAFRDWRKGNIRSLQDLEAEIERRAEAWLNSPEGRQAMIPAVEEWFTKSISPQLEAHINPICDSYGIPRAAFNFSSAATWRGKLPINLVSGAWGFEGLDTVTGIVLSVLIANIAGGGGVALLMQGPIGFIIGLVAGLVTFAVGREAAKTWSKGADLYLWTRQLAREERLRDKLLENQHVLRDKLAESLSSDTETLEKISREIQDSIQAQLHRSVEEVVLLIR